MVFESINRVFNSAEAVVVYDGGCAESLKKGDGRFEDVMDAWVKTLYDCREMPAFGVSLNDMTAEAIKSGLWAEFCFPEKLWYNEMSFEKLLVEVNEGLTGFNLHRYNAECGYYGRCYYVELADGKDLGGFCAVLKS